MIQPEESVSELHVTASASAEAILALLIQQRQISGQVATPDDDLSIGPLDDLSGRAPFWAGYYDQAGETWSVSAAHACWQRFLQSLHDHHSSRLLVWGADNTCDAVFLRLVCHQLSRAGHDIPLFAIDVPGHRAVANCPPPQLAAYIDEARTISTEMRDSLADEFDRLAAHRALLRRYHPRCQPAFEFPGPDIFDALLLKRSAPEWRPALRIIGDVQGAWPEPVNSEFLYSRLRWLVAQGQLQGRGIDNALRACYIALPAASG